MYHLPIKWQCIQTSNSTETNMAEFTIFSHHSYDRFRAPMIFWQIAHWNSSSCNLYFLFYQNPCHVKAQHTHSFMNARQTECTPDCGLQEDCEEEKSAPRYAIQKFGPNYINSGQTESYLSMWSIHNIKIYKMVPLKTTTGIISGAE